MKKHVVRGLVLLSLALFITSGTSAPGATNPALVADSASVLPPSEEVEHRSRPRMRLQRRPSSPVATARRRWVTASTLGSSPTQEVDTDTELPSSGKFVIHNGVAAIFTSPDYPDEYPANVWTTWIFEAQDEDAKLHISCPELSLGRRSRLTLRTEDGERQVFFHNSISPPALTSTSRVTASLRAGRTDSGKMACVVRAELTPQVSLDDLAPVEVNDPLCGRAKPITRIVGGVTAEKGAYPWLVGVTTRSREDMFCGGSIINERYILTAAHCVHGRKVWAVNVQVRKHKRGKDVDELRYKVKRFIEHPGYSRATLQNDIALIELEESLRIQLRRDPRVRPICLPSEPCRGGDGPACFDGRTGAVAGWGVLRERSKDYPENLQEVELPVLTSQDCRDSQPEVITDEMLCTSYEYGGKDACQGDSGGPLTVADGDGLASQVGIVSFGKGCGHKEYPAVYVRVSEYFKWITENAKL